LTLGYAEFEFDLPSALLERIVVAFESLQPAALSFENVARVDEAQGVYQLLLHGELVYVGKTDADKGLRRRLERHASTIQHRHNLQPTDVTFRALRVFVFTAMDLEAQLISHYGGTAWQNSGFGSNDPGRNRDDTRLKRAGFDESYPIDVDHSLDFELTREPRDAASILKELRRKLPYIVRYEGGGRNNPGAHPDLQNTIVTLPEGNLTARRVIQSVLQELPTGWQATDLRSRIILYKESRDYAQGDILGRS
jgi:hypothetical protein